MGGGEQGCGCVFTHGVKHGRRETRLTHPGQRRRVEPNFISNPYVLECPAGLNSVWCLSVVFVSTFTLQRGVQLVATAHGNELQNLVKNPALSDLIGGIQSVTLGECVCLSACLSVHTKAP